MSSLGTGITQQQLDQATFGNGFNYQPIRAIPQNTPKSINYRPGTTQIGGGGNTYQLNQNSSGNWVGKGGYLDTGAGVVNALSAGLGAYTGLQQLGLAKKQFGFEVANTNRNVFNQGTLANNAMDNATNVGLALAGNTLTGSQKASERKKTLGQHVNVARIG